MQPDVSRVLASLRAYASQYPEEGAVVSLFTDFLQSHQATFERAHPPGHWTGSAWLVSADGERVLLMHHRKLDRWLQPGGHADGDTDLARVALREAREETGVTGLCVEGGIFDIDRHRIMGHIPVAHPGGPASPFAFAPGERSPVRANEPEHWHYDVRYVVRAGTDERFTINEESKALAWYPVAEVADDAGFDTSLRRMARKWLLHR
ncbi:MAG: NUDIX hydrolase [Lysobacterales bacterium]|jgi:8-oxo-dGTP pyrophosphatase MutT (NUDIX family)